MFLSYGGGRAEKGSSAIKCFIVLEEIHEKVLALCYYLAIIIYYITHDINNISNRPCFTQRKGTHVMKGSRELNHQTAAAF